MPGPKTKPRGSRTEPLTAFTNKELSEVFGQEAGHDIHVAVLDTWPSKINGKPWKEVVADKLASLPDGMDWQRARLLRTVADGFATIYPDYVDQFGTGEPRCATYDYRRVLRDPYPIPDHGLFIADLIKEVAPKASLSIYRVLNDWGVGDLRTVAYAMENAIRQAKGGPLIINASLGFAPPVALVNEYLAHPDHAIELSLQSIAESNGDLSTASRPRKAAPVWNMDARKGQPDRRDAIGSLWSRGILGERGGKVVLEGALRVLDLLFSTRYLPSNVLIVAASGNDSTSTWVADPRIPAIVEGILGVSAAVPIMVGTDDLGQSEFQWREVVYSNADDFVLPDDGISAFGGDVGVEKDGSIDAPIGIYLSNDVIGGNPFGLAQWSGTSFAAPIAAAYAACIWAADSTLRASAVMEAIIKYPDGSDRRAIPLG